jgi:hypothetical protein
MVKLGGLRMLGERTPKQQVRGSEYIKKIDILGDTSSTTSRRYGV